MDDTVADGKHSQATPRRTYETPALRVYGALQDLTRAVGRNGTVLDGGATGNMTKTS